MYDDLKQVQLFANQWLVNLNHKQTRLMNMTLKRNTDSDKFPIYYRNTKLQVVNSHHHLGLAINDDLRWSNHVDKLLEGN